MEHEEFNQSHAHHDSAPVFVTGATGYVGGRLVPRLLDAGYAVRCYARSPRKLDTRTWSVDPRVRVCPGDVNDVQALADAMRGCRVAYYLIHSMGGAGKHADFARQDRELAEAFARAASQAGVERIIYLGGLGGAGEDLSEHLASRREVESALGVTGIPVTVLRAAVIIGSGSVSFEILRYLTERLPVMTTPRWVRTECQPIAIRDVLTDLVACLEKPETTGQVIEIGGPDVLPYAEMMQITAAELGLRRRIIIPLPVLTPKLSSLWIGLVTPVTPAIARPLAEGLRNRVVVTTDAMDRLLPRERLGTREAVRLAVSRTNAREIETVWSSAGVVPGDPDWAGGTSYQDERSVVIDAPADAVYRAICRIGGGHGWYAAQWLWRVRGWMDKAVGGPGLRRGRRHPEQVAFGEALDFWRVVGLERDRLLALRAEMKLPGEAMLTFRIRPDEQRPEARCDLTMSARFRPKGLLGILYWYSVLPLHHIVFRGMLGGIRRTAEKIHHERSPGIHAEGA
ncbi:MAG: SDR family oxidoreductase [Phycisphaerales bacterium]|nr:SDR family oxidoreductase [Planctomycetota bacterium]MCH8509733.1 SDR family oxidoreductase [Phycisphaerales bacterium]